MRLYNSKYTNFVVKKTKKLTQQKKISRKIVTVSIRLKTNKKTSDETNVINLQ